MAFGFDISRRPGFQGKKSSLGPLEPVAARSVIAPEVRASPTMIPDLTQMPQRPRRQTFGEYWGTKDSSGKTRADRLYDFGTALQRIEQGPMPPVEDNFTLPPAPGLSARDSNWGRGDVSARVRARYQL